MTYYVLLVALWVETTPYEQEQFLWVMQDAMTLEECETLKAEASPYIGMLGGELFCEVDDAV
jgi:hypothetical protein